MSETYIPKLTEEQADAVEKAKELQEERRVLNVSTDPDNWWINGSYKALNALTTKDLSIALYVGYETEKSIEDKVIELYRDAKDMSEYGLTWGVRKEQFERARGIKDTVSLLRPDLLDRL